MENVGGGQKEFAASALGERSRVAPVAASAGGGNTHFPEEEFKKNRKKTS